MSGTRPRSPYAPRLVDWLAIGVIGVVLLPFVGAWCAILAPLIVIVIKAIYLTVKQMDNPGEAENEP